MRINIQAPWEVNPYIKAYITKRVEKLATYNNRIIHADVFLKLGDNVGVEDRLVEIRVKVPRQEYFAHDFADTIERAVARTTEKLKMQLVKKKEKLRGR